jgi:G3E family GTPase
MQLFAAVGPLGAGKTTFVLNVIQALESSGFPTREKVAFVVNDEGHMLDGELAGNLAKVVAMTNGCFTCSDTAGLKTTLAKLEQSGITWAFLEGFGITAGNETKQFLESCPYPFHILCLFSARHHTLDLIRYAGVVKSQVRAATLAVGVTKFEGGNILSLDDSGIPEFVAEEKPGIPLVLIPNTPNIPDVILDIFTKDDKGAMRRLASTSNSVIFRDFRRRHHTSCDCCGHDHNDHSHDHYVHGMHPYSYELIDGATLEDLRRAFDGKEFLLRVKGAVGGHLFNAVHDEWQETIKDQRRFVTFYTSREVNIESDLPGLTEIVVTQEVPAGMEPGYKLIRMETASRDETIREINDLLDGSPTEPVVISSEAGLRLITHPEKFQIAKEISRRPYVIDEWFPRVLKRFMKYWIRCAEIVKDRASEIVPDDIAKNRHELAVSMVWWVNRHGEFFGAEIVQAVERLHPGEMAAQGILSLQSLISITHPETVSWQCLEFTEALSYGLTHGDNSESMLKAARHCLSLATTPDLIKAWSESVGILEEKSRAIIA